MTEDELHELMQAWMNGSSGMRASTGMNKPPKQLRRQWRIGQLKRAKRQRRQKSTKAAKSDMDDLLSRAATTDATNEKRSWRSKLYLTMLLGWSLRVEINYLDTVLLYDVE